MDNNIINEINRLKREKNAVILAHYYTPGEVQAIADHVGDSYALAKTAKNSDADMVVFCGVAFMGESVKILNPEKTVLMPDMSADCPMAHMADTAKIAALRAEYEDLAVVCYINSTAALKCVSDVCVTSSNALKIVRALPNKNIFFIPDRNLGSYVAQQVPEKNIILNDGHCPIHAAISADTVRSLKSAHPGAKVLTHPECREEILALSDYISSTSGILEYASKDSGTEFIICTEDGIAFPLENSCPDKKFYFASSECPCTDMKLNTLEKVLHVLKTGENRVEVDDKTRKRALLPLDRMLEIAK